MTLEDRLKELDKLEAYLKEKGYDYERIDEEKGYINKHQIIVYKDGERSWDVICHMGSYGYEQGLLEAKGFDLIEHDDVEGSLTAQDVIDRLETVKE